MRLEKRESLKARHAMRTVVVLCLAAVQVRAGTAGHAPARAVAPLPCRAAALPRSIPARGPDPIQARAMTRRVASRARQPSRSRRPRRFAHGAEHLRSCAQRRMARRAVKCSCRFFSRAFLFCRVFTRALTQLRDRLAHGAGRRGRRGFAVLARVARSVGGGCSRDVLRRFAGRHFHDPTWLDAAGGNLPWR
jgi:hypothetical protein